jgi:Prokaryotic homologs of the JAB domain
VTLKEQILEAHRELQRSGTEAARDRLEDLQAKFRTRGDPVDRPGGSVALAEPEAPVPRAFRPFHDDAAAHPRAQDQQRREIPELRSDATPRVTVRLRSGALAGIVEELNETGDIPLDCLETGGSLYGRLRDGALELLDASGPGSDEQPRRFENAVKISIAEAKEIEAELQRSWDDQTITACAGWHTHPADDPLPSATDRENALVAFDELQRRSWAAPSHWVDLIVRADSVDGWHQPRVVAWVTRRRGAGAVTEPGRIEIVR